MLSKVIRTILFATIFFLPLAFTTWNQELFEFPKFVILIATSLTILALAVINELDQRSLNFKEYFFPKDQRTRLLHLSVLTVLATQLISTIFSIETTTSFWGYYGRFHQGLLTTISYTILYFAINLYMSQKDTQKVLKISLTSSIIISIYAIAQHFGIDKDLWVQDVQNRVFSTLGQPNWLAAYLVPHIFVLIHYSQKYKTKQITYFYLLFSILLLALLYTKSRSGILAYVVSFISYWLLIIKQVGLTKVKTTLLTSSTITITLFLLIGTPFYNILNTQSLSQEVTVQGAALETGGTESGVIRQIVWQGAIDLIKKNPILGTGPETFAYTYYQTRPVSHNLVSEWDFLYNKAHNEYLNIAATTGLVGLIGYLLFHLALVFRPWANFGNALLAASVINFFITNFFGFSVIPVYLTIIILGSLTTLTKDKKLESKSSPNATVLAAFSAFIILSLPLKLYQADINYAKGKKLASAGQIGQALPYLEKAHKSFPSFDLYLTTLGETYAQISSNLAQEKSPDTKFVSIYAQKALDSTTILLQENPYHQNNLKSAAKTYLTLAQENPIYYQNAAIVLQKAESLAPTDAKVVYNLGLVMSRLENNDQAIKYLEKSIELRPIYQEPYYALTLLYEETKRLDEIPKLLKKAAQNILNPSAELTGKFKEYQIYQ